MPEVPVDGDPRGPCDAAALFELIWSNLVDLLGSAATATLIRRCVKRAATRSPDLSGLTISRINLEYTYSLPLPWRQKSTAAIGELRGLVHELQPILSTLTGSIVLGKLSSLPELQRCCPFTTEARR